MTTELDTPFYDNDNTYWFELEQDEDGIWRARVCDEARIDGKFVSTKECGLPVAAYNIVNILDEVLEMMS